MKLVQETLWKKSSRRELNYYLLDNLRHNKYLIYLKTLTD